MAPHPHQERSAAGAAAGAMNTAPRPTRWRDAGQQAHYSTVTALHSVSPADQFNGGASIGRQVPMHGVGAAIEPQGARIRRSNGRRYSAEAAEE